MNEPQVWTVIGVFATALFGMLGFVAGMLTRMLRSEFNSVRSEFTAIRAEIAALSTRIDHLDRDVQFLMKREFGDNTY